MKHLLVTGGAGFIGANFVHYWLAHYPEDRIVVVDALTYAGNPASLLVAVENRNYRFVHGDICDPDLIQQLMVEESIDWIVHFAAESHVDRSITGPDEFIRTNVLGTHCLLKAAHAYWRESKGFRVGIRFHHVSTDEVYGSLSATAAAFTEATAYAPNSPYSASKAASDHLVRAYWHTYGLPVTTSNCSNNYGPYQFPEKLIPLSLVRALDGKPIGVYGKGENVRDWLYVQDHCRAIDAVLQDGRAGEVYNVGGCNEWRNIDIVQRICSVLDSRFSSQPALREQFPQCPAARNASTRELITFVADRPGHDWRYAIDAAKLSHELDFEPAEQFETGIEKTIDWYLGNENWWRAILSGEYSKR